MLGTPRSTPQSPHGLVATRRACASLAVLAACTAAATPARPASAQHLADVVVTATRIATPAFDVPATIASVPGAALTDDQLGINLAEGVRSVAGLLVRDQYDYAQDEQVSIRGIGAGSAFGVRGVRIYQDGIPQSGPDGQGQVSEFNLGSAERIEVLEGPFSALYGNSSGGVIQIFTAAGAAPGSVRFDLGYGSFGAVRAGVDASDAIGKLRYNLNFTHFTWRGFRPQQRARSESFNSKVSDTLDRRDSLTLLANVLSRPDAQDAQGLTAAEFAANPDQSAAAALAFNTRKSLEQQEGGLIFKHEITADQSLRLMGYYGHRTVLQYLSIPVGAQFPPASSGGVVDLHRDFGGGDARWTLQTDLAGHALAWVAGASYDTQNELRRGYNNFIGATLGVQGALRRDENDIARNLDEYTQASLALARRWSLTVGVRHSEVKFITQDHFITPGNGSDSGEVAYTATSPVAGILYAPRHWLHLYAAFGQGFRTPLASELAYRPDGQPGTNLALRPARSNNGEIGAKLHVGHTLSATVAAFLTHTNDEIVVVSNHGGRSTYQNAGRTRRSGAQASLEYQFVPRWRLQLAYTYVEAIYIDAFRTCSVVPCVAATQVIPAGNRLPGVARNDAYAKLSWGGKLGWHASLSGQYLGAIPANEANSASAGAYAQFNVSGGYRTAVGAQRLEVFLRINNLLNRRYVAAVIVDQSSGAYFEPGPGLNALAGVTLTLR
jgi:iron complex outermembrane receptor protein